MVTITIVGEGDNTEKHLKISKVRAPGPRTIHFCFQIGIYAKELDEDEFGPTFRGWLAEYNATWIEMGMYGVIVDFDKLEEIIGHCPEFDRYGPRDGWTPSEISTRGRPFLPIPDMAMWEYEIRFAYPPPLPEESAQHLENSGEIVDSLRAFRRDHPSRPYTGFLMMQFGHEKAHARIASALRVSFARFGIKLLRADDSAYHPDLYYNILTYIKGCGLAVAAFDRILSEQFNPNVSFELGFCFAYGIPTLLLKDKRLPRLPTDIVGRLYIEFDSYEPEASLAHAVSRWLTEKGYFELNDSKSDTNEISEP